ncbi:MAG: hypothetical protein AVDCRST_MAG52-3416, partial [uncultured Blastococcus sp.]
DLRLRCHVRTAAGAEGLGGRRVRRCRYRSVGCRGRPALSPRVLPAGLDRQRV